MDHTKLSQSLEDYLEMVHMLRLANGIARVKDIAAALTVKMPSVAKAMIELKKLGLVTQEPYSGIELTEEGQRVAAMILNRHILLKGFLIIGSYCRQRRLLHGTHPFGRDSWKNRGFYEACGTNSVGKKSEGRKRQKIGRNRGSCEILPFMRG